MGSDRMQLSAFEAIERAVKNVQANWQLIVVQLLLSVTITILVIAGFVPIVLAMGVSFFRSVIEMSEGGVTGPPDLERVLELLSGGVGPLLFGLLGAFCIWTVAFLVYCYFQAGIFGQLAAGEARARAAARGRAPAKAFRSFDVASFRRSAGAGIWKFFWLINIFVGLGMILTIALGAVMAGLVIAATESGRSPLFFLLGCSAVLFFLPIWLLFVSWSQMSKAELVSAPARSEKPSGVFAAMGTGLHLTFERIGAVLLTFCLVLVATISLSLVFIPLSIVADLSLGDSWMAQIAADLGLMVVQSAIGGVVGLIYAGVFVSLAFWRRPRRGELLHG